MTDKKKSNATSQQSSVGDKKGKETILMLDADGKDTGDIYKGYAKDGKPHGKGKMSYKLTDEDIANGVAINYYDGEFVMGVK